MKIITIKAASAAEKSVVRCRKKVMEKALPAALNGYRGALIFTDTNVYGLYGKKLARYLPGVPVFAMPAGEKNKNAETLFSLLGAMAEAGLHRDSVLVALGGGVVGDVGGLAAALYMRGIACIQVPTTLLAQVDSSVGGKTAIDFRGVKNLVGAFRQPALVLADPAFFGTLPRREICCGLGEIVKHGALSAPLFERLVSAPDLFDLGFLAGIVPENIAFKADVVRRDPHETGLRKCLNLGHTTGHAIELCTDLSHGECVLIGLIFEAELAKKYAVCDGAYLDELIALCKRVLSCDLRSVDVSAAAELARLDKKNETNGRVVVCAPRARASYALLTLGYGEYAHALAEIKEKLC